MICAFISEHRASFGVAPICRVLTEHGCAIAPRTYYAHLRRAPSKRSLWDTAVTEILAGYYEPDQDGRRKPESLYGASKMWAHLLRSGIPVARCTVERLMRSNGWRGVTRQKRVITTISDPDGSRAPDLVKRNFRTSEPDKLHVADFTYVPVASGFGYTAFVIDAFAGLIVAWECSLTKETAFVERAIRQAAAYRARQGHPLVGGTVHHSDAGSQYCALRFGETLSLCGFVPSVGSVGDAYDKTVASYCTSFLWLGGSSFGEARAHLFYESRVARRWRLEEPYVLVVCLMGNEQAGTVPGLDGRSRHAEALG